MTPEEQRLIAELQAHPAWALLRKTARERMDKTFLILAKQLMAGTPVPEQDIAYNRGFFAGMKHLLDKPKLAEADIARELAKREDVTLDA